MAEESPDLVKYYASRSYWLESCGENLCPRPKLSEELAVDIAILGSGFTGLWTAYYLLLQDPSLNIAIIEKHITGFGASGRNAGWCSPKFSLTSEVAIERFGEEAAREIHLSMYASVNEIERVIKEEKMNVDWKKAGFIKVSLGNHLLYQFENEMKTYQKLGIEKYYQILNKDDTKDRIRAEGLKGSILTKVSAVLHPGKLARQLARILEERGVKIYEQTEALIFKEGDSSNPPKLVTSEGIVTANIAVVMAGEAYLSQMTQFRRHIIPMYSSMVVTEPLSKAQWASIGWENREAVGSNTLAQDYLQRTADGRILFGLGNAGRYRYASKMKDSFDIHDSVIEWLKQRVIKWFPSVSFNQFTHAWGGPIGVTSDWTPNFQFNQQTRVAKIFGYFGQGVSTANLAGRILTDLIYEKKTSLTDLPMVQHSSAKWVPEPLRWVGARYVQSEIVRLDKRSDLYGIAPKGNTLAERMIRH
ncbi:Gamma-glutamylputrescine oxidoreductase [Neobacillus rhizosphaerae]|uniref:Gamma-glutamylputrescine oxidoreductase n=1 Tax=Neobacillus rhizosphaerae TaxID=2880965 RepID=A0ABM9ER92_9BACI|nr:FAD-dependent oxidoreductase [Neobacillus rhizosphaerae]CAH2715166.1 Gamma-glutamylputrescine oxidoreductase [Neobacillus rhizosphaerae]